MRLVSSCLIEEVCGQWTQAREKWEVNQGFLQRHAFLMNRSNQPQTVTPALEMNAPSAAAEAPTEKTAALPTSALPTAAGTTDIAEALTEAGLRVQHQAAVEAEKLRKKEERREMMRAMREANSAGLSKEEEQAAAKSTSELKQHQAKQAKIKARKKAKLTADLSARAAAASAARLYDDLATTEHAAGAEAPDKRAASVLGEDFVAMTVYELKQYLSDRKLDFSSCLERQDLEQICLQAATSAAASSFDEYLTSSEDEIEIQLELDAAHSSCDHPIAPVLQLKQLRSCLKQSTASPSEQFRAAKSCLKQSSASPRAEFHAARSSSGSCHMPESPQNKFYHYAMQKTRKVGPIHDAEVKKQGGFMHYAMKKMGQESR